MVRGRRSHRWTDWWAGKDELEQIELYTRSSFGWITAFSPFVLLLVVRGGQAQVGTPAATAALVALVAVQAVPVGIALDRTIRNRPVGRLVWASLAAATALVVAGSLVVPGGDLRGWARLVALASCFGPAAALGARRYVPLAVVAAVAQGLLSGVADEGAGALVAFAFAVVVVCSTVAVTVQLSIWIVDLVRRVAVAERDRARLAVAEERLRFSRDLHDVVGRDLSAIAVTSDLVAELARRGRPEAVERAEEVRAIASESLRQVREVVRGYRGVDLDAELAGAAGLLRSAGATCTVRNAVVHAPAEVRAAAAWVVREGVTNVVRHSGATTCSIEVDEDEDGVRVRIENDGAVDREVGTGSGLVGLAERLRPLGGTVATSRRDGTFRLQAHLPPAAVATA